MPQGREVITSGNLAVGGGAQPIGGSNRVDLSMTLPS